MKRVFLSVCLAGVFCALFSAGCGKNKEESREAEKETALVCDLVAKYVSAPPNLSGKMDDPAWKLAPATAGFVAPFPPADASTAANPEYLTTARVLWDERNIYVAMEIRQPGPIFATMTQHDDKLYEQDIAELFLDVGTDGAQYAEYQVSPNGVTGDYYHRWSSPPTYPADKLDWDQMKNHKTEIEWNPKQFRGAASRLEEGGKQVGWTVEMAVPMEEVLANRGLPGSLRRGQIFKANFIRYIWLAGAKPEDKRIHRQLSWSPVTIGCPHVSPMAMKTIGCGK